jgi:hypothetical protein
MLKSIFDIRNSLRIEPRPCAIIHEKRMPRTYARVAEESPVAELKDMTRVPMKTTAEMQAILEDLARRTEIGPVTFDESSISLA